MAAISSIMPAKATMLSISARVSVVAAIEMPMRMLVIRCGIGIARGWGIIFGITSRIDDAARQSQADQGAK